jgi:hypothetical protein
MPTQDGSLGKKLDARCEFALINDKKMGFPFWGRIFDLFFGITIFKYIFSQELNFFSRDGIILGAPFRRQGAENANQIKIVFTIIYLFF